MEYTGHLSYDSWELATPAGSNPASPTITKMAKLADEKKLSSEGTFKPSEKEKARVKFLQDRFQEMESAEKEKGLRENLKKWNKLYVPHEFDATGLRKWQSKTAKNVAFTKIQTALAVLIEKLPSFQFFQRTDQDKPLVPLWKALMEYIEDVGGAKRQLKKFFFNVAKDGTAVGQVFWKYDTREVQFETSYDPETDKSEYEKQTIEDFNNPYWTVLERKDCYLDEKATSWDSKDEHPIRDWFKRTVYDKDEFETRFPSKKYPNAKFCKSGGELAEGRSGEGIEKVMQSIGKDQYEVLFYENKPKDEFSIISNGVLLRDRPLPYRHKQLSIFGAKFFDKPDDIDGIGIPEAIEGDEAMLDNLSNATIDEVNLLIKRVLIVGYGEELEDEDLELKPNMVLRLRDPGVAKWLEKSGIGAEPFNQQAIIKGDMDEKTGISKELLGGMSERRQTATETAINREAGLRRMKPPLDSVEDAMEDKQRLMIGLTKQIYTIPTKKELDENGIESLTYRSVRLPLKIDGEKGNRKLIPTPEEEVFEINPSDLMDEPDIKIKHMSMMPISKAMIKQDKMQFYSLIGNHPYIDTYKAVRNLCDAWEEDPEDWLIAEEQIAQQQQQAAAGGQMMGTEGMETPSGEGGGAPTRQTVGTETGTAEVPTQGGEQSTFKKFFQKLTGRMS